MVTVFFSNTNGLVANVIAGTGQPELSGSNSCVGGCRGIVTINSDGSYVYVSLKTLL